jgi:hypothetical protein
MYPKLPRWVYSHLGVVPVETTDLNPDRDTDEYVLMGQYLLETRKIQLDKGLSEEQSWQTFFHELVHLIIADSGLDELLKPNVEDALCDTIGTYLAASVRNGFLSITDDPTKEG